MDSANLTLSVFRPGVRLSWLRDWNVIVEGAVITMSPWVPWSFTVPIRARGPEWGVSERERWYAMSSGLFVMLGYRVSWAVIVMSLAMVVIVVTMSWVLLCWLV